MYSQYTLVYMYIFLMRHIYFLLRYISLINQGYHQPILGNKSQDFGWSVLLVLTEAPNGKYTFSGSTMHGVPHLAGPLNQCTANVGLSLSPSHLPCPCQWFALDLIDAINKDDTNSVRGCGCVYACVCVCVCVCECVWAHTVLVSGPACTPCINNYVPGTQA